MSFFLLALEIIFTRNNFIDKTMEFYGNCVYQFLTILRELSHMWKRYRITLYDDNGNFNDEIATTTKIILITTTKYLWLQTIKLVIVYLYVRGQ